MYVAREPPSSPPAVAFFVIALPRDRAGHAPFPCTAGAATGTGSALPHDAGSGTVSALPRDSALIVGFGPATEPACGPPDRSPESGVQSSSARPPAARRRGPRR